MFSKESEISGDVLPPMVFDLSGRTLLCLSGADRLRYLNGQVSQDLKKLAPGRALPSCVTSAKGRLQAEIWVTQTDDALWVDAAPELRDALAARLERYIVADDVVIEDHTGRHAMLHCTGSRPHGDAFPGGFSAVRADRLGAEGWDVRLPKDRIDGVLAALGGTGALAGEADWEALRVFRGIPAWGAELNEETLPPEAGLDKTHIDYHKGCYIGQEVISRLKSVGHVNRSLFRFHGVSEALPVKGDALRTGDGAASAGEITSVAADGKGGFWALGYLRRGQHAEKFLTSGGIEVARRG
jgi:folate-binding protein YgfZ